MINWLANPARFTRFSATVLPWCAWATFAVLAAGLYLALVRAPPDYQQGESVRIMYIHVPAAWMALSVYLFVAVTSAIALVWRHPLAEIAAAAEFKTMREQGAQLMPTARSQLTCSQISFGPAPAQSESAWHVAVPGAGDCTTHARPVGGKQIEALPQSSVERQQPA